MIRAVQVTKVFNAGKPNQYTAIDGIDLEVRTGGISILKGPSGSGKTTLLTILGCMSRPTAGRVFLEEREITSLPERFLTEIRRRRFGFIFQQLNLVKGITSLENVMIPAYPTGESYASLRKRAGSLLESFDLGHRSEAKVEWLSGGEAQRVAIARALINNPSVIIADEPTAHLDSRLSLEFMATMRRLNNEGRTIIIASHDPLVCESDPAAVVIHLRDGRIVAGEVPR